VEVETQDEQQQQCQQHQRCEEGRYGASDVDGTVTVVHASIDAVRSGQAARCDHGSSSGRRRPVQLTVFVASVGQRSGLEQARRFGGRLGPGVPVRAVASAIAPDWSPAVAAAATAAVSSQACVVVAVRDGHGPRHHQDHSRVPEVLQKGGQVMRRPVRRAGRRAQ